MGESYSAFCECDFYGYSEFCTSSTRKARKQHYCDECSSTILPGEVYEYAAGKQDGDMWVSKTCPRCLALVEWIRAHVPCYCRAYGDLLEDRLQELVWQARQTPGFAFGILRRVVAIRKHKYAIPQAR